MVYYKKLVILLFLATFFSVVFLFQQGVLAETLEASVVVNQVEDQPTLARRVVLSEFIIEGWAYPYAEVYLMKDGIIVDTSTASQNAKWSSHLKNLSPGVYNFAVRAEDAVNKEKSSTISYTLTLVPRMTTTVSSVFFPPTLKISDDELASGESLEATGQTVPGSEVFVYLDDQEDFIDKVAVNSEGFWNYFLDTSELEIGRHNIKVKAALTVNDQERYLSYLSPPQIFYLKDKIVDKPGYEEEAPGEKKPATYSIADFNQDNKVDFSDFSILSYWWGKPNKLIDLDKSGKVDLVDFSIFLYYWTG